MLILVEVLNIYGQMIEGAKNGSRLHIIIVDADINIYSHSIVN